MPRRKHSWLCALVFALATAVSYGNDPGSSSEFDVHDPAIALSKLQELHAVDNATFVVQSEMDKLIRAGGGGACASAAAIDLLQTFRLMAGLDDHPAPHQCVFAAFSDQPALLEGRVTNGQFVRLVEFYERYLPGANLDISIQSAPHSKHGTPAESWQPAVGPILDVEPRQVSVVSYTVTKSDGNVLGRHFVLLKESTANGIVVVDPARPMKDHRYVLDYHGGPQGARERLFLLPPADVPSRGMTNEVNTVFTVELSGDALPVDELTVEELKDKIDATAAELRNTDDYLSPRVWRKKTAAFGLPALDLPGEYDGLDWPTTKVIQIFRHAGRHNLNFRDVVGGAHVRPLLSSSTPEVRDIVGQVARGEGYMAIAITEPDVGTDVSAIKSTSRRVAGGYVLSGEKRFNARLEQATHVIIFTQGTAGQPGKLSVFVVPIDSPGLEIVRLQAHGLTGNSFGGLKFKELFVPESHMIGADGDGLSIFREHFMYWRLMQAAAAIGTGERALEMMAERIKTRQVDGGPIGRFTHLQQPIGQYTTELKMAYALSEQAAELIDRGEYTAAYPLICGIKAEGVENALSAVDAAVRAYGGEGYSNLVDLSDRLRDLNGLRIADGTTDVMRMEVVRRTYGEEFWDMAIDNDW